MCGLGAWFLYWIYSQNLQGAFGDNMRIFNVLWEGAVLQASTLDAAKASQPTIQKLVQLGLESGKQLATLKQGDVADFGRRPATGFAL